MISIAMMRLRPSVLRSSTCESTPSSVVDSCMRTCCCWCGGNTSMTRSTVSGPPVVCRVASTRWPVSAAVIAAEMVSRSRISPTRMTSGSWRRTRLSAEANECVSSPISRWLTYAFLLRCMNSIGSSIVMMWTGRVVLMWSTIAASVVDLPEPVGPVTSTRPRGRSARYRHTFGSPRSSMVGMRIGMTRNTAPIELRCWKTFARNRETPGIE